MFWVILAVALIIVAAIVIAFMNRFYRKATREVALVRTGAGGQRVVMDGGCLALPFLHQVSEVNMKTTRFEVSRTGERSIITEDRLRVDVSVELYVRVDSSRDGIATAAQALGGKSFRAAELAELIEGKLVDSMQSVAARHSMDSLHENRGQYVKEIADDVGKNLAQNGLALESVSLTRLDQTPFQALDENNAFNAVGMRRLAEVIAANRKQRAAIETDAEVSVRQSQLDAIKRKLQIEQEEEEAQIAQQKQIEKTKADSGAEIAEQQALSEARTEQARVNRDREVRASEIGRDKDLRQMEMSANLETEISRQDNAIAIALKKREEAKAEAQAEMARTEVVAAQEEVQSEKDRAVAERARQVSLIRAQEEADVDTVRTRSTVETTVDKAKAEAEATNLRAEARKSDMMAESEGKAALVAAENSLSDAIIKMRVDMHKLDKLPEMLAEMVKPAEKIEHIRINQISGFGAGGGGGATNGDGTGSSPGGGEKPLVNQAVDSILGMALQMPAIKRIGEEIGVSVTDGLDGIADAAKATGSASPGGTQGKAPAKSSGDKTPKA